MFDLEKQIATWRKEMRAAGISRPEILNELESHLREEIQRQMSLTEAGAFQNAVAKLGEGKLLKQEFAKARQPRSFALRDNPLSLNLIGVWFIISGLNALPMLWDWLSRSGWSHRFGAGFQWGDLFGPGLSLVLCSQALIGIGLLRRRDFWRGIAVGWFLLASILFGWGEILVHLPWSQAHTANFMPWGFMMTNLSAPYLCRAFLELPLSITTTEIISFLNVGVLIWAYYLFTKSSVRELFHRREKNYV